MHTASFPHSNTHHIKEPPLCYFKEDSPAKTSNQYSRKSISVTPSFTAQCPPCQIQPSYGASAPMHRGGLSAMPYPITRLPGCWTLDFKHQQRPAAVIRFGGRKFYWKDGGCVESAASSMKGYGSERSLPGSQPHTSARSEPDRHAPMTGKHGTKRCRCSPGEAPTYGRSYGVSPERDDS